MIPEQFSSYLSYSRYRGINDFSRLSDKYFSRIVDGNLICTDSECDIGVDGNIVLVTPNGDVLHIGRFPIPEKGNVSISFDNSNNLHLSYMVYYDCDLKHGGREEEVIDTHLTPERVLKMKVIKLGIYLNENIKAYYGGSLRNSLSINLGDDCITLYGTFQQIHKFGRYQPKHFKQSIVYIDGQGFVLLPDKDGNDPICSEVIKNNKLDVLLNNFNKSIGLGKNTTFYLTSFSDEFCAIADTSDGTNERVERNKIISLCKQGNLSVVGIDIIGNQVILRKVVGFR